jgi:hypothetical protein
MTDDPLPDDVADFFRRAEPPPLPDGLEARVMARVETTLAATASSAMVQLTLTKAVALLLAGAVAGVAMDRVIVSREPRVPEPAVGGAPSPAPVAAPAPAPPAVPVDVPPAVPAPSPAPTHPHAPARTRDTNLAEERTQLEMARTDLARNDAAQALGVLQEAQRRFPSGALAEEREVLMIQTLTALGRVSDAQARAKQFELRFPDSPLLPAIRGVLTR